MEERISYILILPYPIYFFLYRLIFIGVLHIICRVISIILVFTSVILNTHYK